MTSSASPKSWHKNQIVAHKGDVQYVYSVILFLCPLRISATLIIGFNFTKTYLQQTIQVVLYIYFKIHIQLGISEVFVGQKFLPRRGIEPRPPR